MKVIIAGTEEFTDKEFLFQSCLDIIAKEQYEREIPNKELGFVSGHNPRGGDYYGEQFAKKYGFSPKLFPADWNNMSEQPCLPKNGFYGLYNALAGHNRNQRMIDHVAENGGGILIAFRINNSPGTTDVIKRAKKAGIKIFQIDYDKDRKIKIWNG